jgi:hypothetical protein
MPRTTVTTHLGFEAARRALGLPRWRMQLARQAALLTFGRQGSVPVAEVDALLADPAAHARFEQTLRGQELLVSRQAADVLGISQCQFLAAVEARLIAVAKEETWRYHGQVRSYRRAEVETAGAAIAAWLAKQPARRPVRRSAEARAELLRQQTMRRGWREHTADEHAQRLAAVAARSPDAAPAATVGLWLHYLNAHLGLAQRRAGSQLRIEQRARQCARGEALELIHDQAIEVILHRQVQHPLPGLKAVLVDRVEIDVCPACRERELEGLLRLLEEERADGQAAHWSSAIPFLSPLTSKSGQPLDIIGPASGLPGEVVA